MSATVTTPQEIKEALLDGENVLNLKAVVFTSADECINFSEFHKLGNGLSLQGTGGTYLETAVYRAFEDGPPLLYFPYDRDWELRFDGLLFDGLHHSGQMLKIDYCQQSLFYDVRFNYCGASGGLNPAPFDIAAPTCNFDFIQCMHNSSDGIIREATMVRVTSGLLQTEWGQRNGGLQIIAPTHNPPHSFAEALRITDLHNEGCNLTVSGYNRGVLLDGGYWLAATAKFENCGQVDYDMKAGAWNESSTMFINGEQIDPMSPTKSEPKPVPRKSFWQRIKDVF